VVPLGDRKGTRGAPPAQDRDCPGNYRQRVLRLFQKIFGDGAANPIGKIAGICGEG
jgi:hypothetical protein